MCIGALKYSATKVLYASYARGKWQTESLSLNFNTFNSFLICQFSTIAKSFRAKTLLEKQEAADVSFNLRFELGFWGILLSGI